MHSSLVESNCLIESPTGLLRSECRSWEYFDADSAHWVMGNATSSSSREFGVINVLKERTKRAVEDFLRVFDAKNMKQDGNASPGTEVGRIRMAYDRLNARREVGEYQPLVWYQNGARYVAGIDPETLTFVFHEASYTNMKHYIELGMEAVNRRSNPNATLENLAKNLKSVNPAYRLAMDGYPNRYQKVSDFPDDIFRAPEMKLVEVNYSRRSTLHEVIVEDVEGTYSYSDIVNIYDTLNPSRSFEDRLLLFSDKNGKIYVAGFPDRDDADLHVLELPWQEFERDVAAGLVKELPGKYPAWRLALNYVLLIDGWGVKAYNFAERAKQALPLSERQLEGGQSLKL